MLVPLRDNAALHNQAIRRRPFYAAQEICEPAQICIAEEACTWRGLAERNQVGSGRFSADVKVARTPELEFSRVRWAPGISVRGEIIPGYTALIFDISTSSPTHYRARAMDETSVAVIREGDDFDYRWLGDATMIDINVSDQLLERCANTLLHTTLDSLLVDNRLRIVSGEAIARSASHICALLAATEKSPDLVTDPRAVKFFEDIVLDAVIGAVDTGARTSGSEARRRIARTAEAYLRDQLTEHITVQELCALTGASKRTLHLAFIDCFGQSPKQYLKTVRLNRARHDLRNPLPGTRVTDIAMKYGFFHLGRFSVSYREMFLETPHQTLRRAYGIGGESANDLH